MLIWERLCTTLGIFYFVRFEANIIQIQMGVLGSRSIKI